MNDCFKRFLVSFLLPPMVGTCVWIALIALETAPSGQTADFLLIAPFIYLYALLCCLIPGQAYFWIHELLLRRQIITFSDKGKYLALGSGLGCLSGLAIGSAFGTARALPLFLPIGMAAGCITSWTNLLVSRNPQARSS